MALINSVLLVAEVANNTSNAILISLLATLGFTFFSVVISSIYKKNFIEPVLLSKVINYHLKDSPTWLNRVLGTTIHFFMGYLFAEAHLFLYRILTPAWYNALFLGLANGILGALVWYAVIRIYRKVLTVNVSQYLIQLVIGHIIFALIIVYMYAPPHLSANL
ncbi:MAG TPA: hypothetical protein VL125_16745 [Pelobium sp.]|nr:hypothetical protein [Pelobium sp.]